ncbi:arsenic resistance protein [Kocuria sp. cx-455]|uniref:arsenic resistance protein n=1 Tax=Kocuria sp. cx-455 TaxID=2771377 RepID=UPI0016888FD7|nr:arsenic resistance protein [Kocuria sp. cx-455]MBD2764904.1 arsenic resistance protein [Kocuria sp. cx-455]
MIQWFERHQVALYVGSIGVAAIVGLTMPGIAAPAETLINPVLALLLYATFLGIPFTRLGDVLRNWAFLRSTLWLNFVLAPVVVFGLSRFVAHDQALLAGVLLVLLCPCVDYVMVFTGLAGGAHERLLAASPVLMLLQMLLLPVYLWLMAGADMVSVVEFGPFVEAFVLLIALPLAAAILTQLAAGTRAGRILDAAATAAMVPLMMLTLAVVVASQIAGVRAQLSALLVVIPLFVAFALIMFCLGQWLGRRGGYDVPARRALVFSGVTRNSLVILPLALALPAVLGMAPLVVVTQTLLELLVMVAMVRLVPSFSRT